MYKDCGYSIETEISAPVHIGIGFQVLKNKMFKLNGYKNRKLQGFYYFIQRIHSFHITDLKKYYIASHRCIDQKKRVKIGVVDASRASG